jgi:hypothetical protein
MKARALLLACAACGSVDNKQTDAAVDTKAIDAAIDAPDGPACDVTKPFGTPIALPGNVNSGNHERWGVMSGDELTVYFSDIAADRELYYATRASTSGAFGMAMKVPGVNTTANEEHPAITADGLIFIADHSFGNTADLGIATRSTAAQDFPALGSLAVVNQTNTHELDGWLSRDGRTLLFGSDRIGADYRVFMATRNATTDPFGTPSEVAVTNTAGATDSGGVLSEDKLEIFWYSNRVDGTGGGDIWHATRATASGTFGPAAEVTELNTTASDLTGWLSQDRCRFLLASDRLGTYDLFLATRPK